MGNAVLCTADDGQPAAYMITDMVDGGNTLVCAAHWVDLCLSVAQAAVDGQPAPAAPEPEAGPGPEAEPEPGPGSEAAPDSGRSVQPPGTLGGDDRLEDVPPPPDPGPPDGRSPTGPSGADTAGEDDDTPGGFAPATIARALDDGQPAPDRLLHARSSPGKRPRRTGQPRNG